MPASHLRPLLDEGQRFVVARGVFAVHRVSTASHHQLLLQRKETLLQTRLPTVSNDSLPLSVLSPDWFGWCAVICSFLFFFKDIVMALAGLEASCVSRCKQKKVIQLVWSPIWILQDLIYVKQMSSNMDVWYKLTCCRRSFRWSLICSLQNYFKKNQWKSNRKKWD